MAASACKLGHGKPRDGDGKVEQRVEGAQEHEDTSLESTVELNLPNWVIRMKFVEDRRFVVMAVSCEVLGLDALCLWTDRQRNRRGSRKLN